MSRYHISLLLSLIFVLPVHAQYNWTKHASNPVLTVGPSAWDARAIGQPCVLFENDTIKMWYPGVGLDWKARICYAWSTDGINWTKHTQVVLDNGPAGSWDAGWLDTPEVFRDSSGYKMLYYGDSVWQPPADNTALGLARSQDGIHWVKEASNPVFDRDSFGSWDGTWVESPAVYYDTSTTHYMMWYNGMDTNTWKVQIGLAYSYDALQWNRHPGNPLIQNGSWGAFDDMWLGTPSVINFNGDFLMWYAGTRAYSFNPGINGFDTVFMMLASSTDGINWNKYQHNPLFNTFSPPFNPLVDSAGPWAPDVIYHQNSGNFMMWYESHGGISFAQSPLTIDIGTNTHEHSDIKIYPVPANKKITIESPEILQNVCIKVISSSGVCLSKRENLNGQKWELNLSDLPSGIYIVMILDKNSQISKMISLL